MSVAEKVGVIPETATLEASFNVMVMVDVATPFATTELVPVIVEFAAETAPGAKTTVPPTLTTGVAILKIFVSVVVELKVHVETPDALVALHAP